jgi:hypothetical protein
VGHQSGRIAGNLTAAAVEQHQRVEVSAEPQCRAPSANATSYITCVHVRVRSSNSTTSRLVNYRISQLRTGVGSDRIQNHAVDNTCAVFATCGFSAEAQRMLPSCKDIVHVYWCKGFSTRPPDGTCMVQEASINTRGFLSEEPFRDSCRMKRLHICLRSTRTRHVLTKHHCIPYHHFIHHRPCPGRMRHFVS